MEKDSRISELQEDWGKLRSFAAVLWHEKRLYIKYAFIAVAVAVVIVFSIPKTYSTSVMLAPEAQKSPLSGSMSSLASMAGLNLGGMSEDAFGVDLYPTIVSSKDFLTRLFDVRVRSAERDIDTTYSAYLSHYQKSAWWSYPVKWVGGAIKVLMPDDVSGEGKTNVNKPKSLTKDEYALYKGMQGCILCSVDEYTGILTITVHDQDAEICTMLADTVVNRLNEFILGYRTHKARTDYEYTYNLCEDARVNYLRAQGEYAEFVATHTDIYSPVVKAKAEFMENEAQLAYTAYSQLVAQMQLAQTKLRESTPVYTVIESAYVPERASSPKKVLTVLAFLFLSAVAASAKLFYKYFIAGDERG
ncbi:MAG: hypothetical protein NC388_00710 [Clostridium sp.]|nr:hypothetical protein [Clostridium sp.]